MIIVTNYDAIFDLLRLIKNSHELSHVTMNAPQIHQESHFRRTLVLFLS